MKPARFTLQLAHKLARSELKHHCAYAVQITAWPLAVRVDVLYKPLCPWSFLSTFLTPTLTATTPPMPKEHKRKPDSSFSRPLKPNASFNSEIAGCTLHKPAATSASSFRGTIVPREMQRDQEADSGDRELQRPSHVANPTSPSCYTTDATGTRVSPPATRSTNGRAC